MSPETEFRRCYNDLIRLEGVKAVHWSVAATGEGWVFTSAHRNMVPVTLYWHKKNSSFVGIEIKGADTAYWHTAENADLSYHMALAKAALEGRIGYNTTKFKRSKEICFEVGGKWECTSTSNNTWLHYIATRKSITSPPPVACLVCGHFTIRFHGSYEVCPICYWEDDGIDDDHLSGPNRMSLKEAKENYCTFGATQRRFIALVRPPEPDELP